MLTLLSAVDPAEITKASMVKHAQGKQRRHNMGFRKRFEGKDNPDAAEDDFLQRVKRTLSQPTCRPEVADAKFVKSCADLHQIEYLKAYDYQDVSPREVLKWERRTFKRMMKHLVNLPPLRD